MSVREREREREKGDYCHRISRRCPGQSMQAAACAARSRRSRRSRRARTCVLGRAQDLHANPRRACQYVACPSVAALPPAADELEAAAAATRPREPKAAICCCCAASCCSRSHSSCMRCELLAPFMASISLYHQRERGPCPLHTRDEWCGCGSAAVADQAKLFLVGKSFACSVCWSKASRSKQLLRMFRSARMAAAARRAPVDKTGGASCCRAALRAAWLLRALKTMVMNHDHTSLSRPCTCMPHTRGVFPARWQHRLLLTACTRPHGNTAAAARCSRLCCAPRHARTLASSARRRSCRAQKKKKTALDHWHKSPPRPAPTPHIQ